MPNLRRGASDLIAEVCAQYTENKPSDQVLRSRIRAIANKRYDGLREALPHWENREALDNLIVAIYAEVIVALRKVCHLGQTEE